MSYAPASFRDPDARVFSVESQRVLRALSARAAAFDAAARAGGLIEEFVRDGLLVENSRCLDVATPAGWTAVVESRRLPFANYPYEWSFGMLQAAALLTLELAERALVRDAVLRDASAYNVFFDGVRPTFIDISSLGPYEEGMPWLAYAQFCDHFLAPLMLEAYKRIPFQPLLRSNLEGVPVGTQLAPLLSGRDLLRPGVLLHVKLRALIERRTQQLGTGGRREVRRMRVPRSAVLANIRRLRRVIRRLASRRPSVWTDYERTSTYGPELTQRKEAFVASACERSGRGRLAWDLGANTGRYSRILAQHFDHVVAMDADAGVIDRLYHDQCASGRSDAILPLVVDLMNPSPAQGWRGVERDSLVNRGRPNLLVALALIHHLCLGRGVPLADFLAMVSETAPIAIVEFVSRDDPMSKAVLATKVDVHAGYDLGSFRTLAERHGRILAEEVLSSTRSLFFLGR